ncbi:MAG TPA: hypothetical protein VK988_06290, partial [Acidimicrobiales bacterium]|nr:hypothetical protein [Acidimicrobiales bacterium]
MVPIRNDTDQTLWAEVRDESGNLLILDEVVEDIVYVRQMDLCDRAQGRIRLEPSQRVVTTTP